MNKSLIEKINLVVNNTISYKRDQEDHWQSAIETIEKGTGDCEDFALLKMTLLKGVLPDDQLRVYYVKSDRGPHMVLQVGNYILDNLTDELLPTNEYPYKPIYQIDSSGVIYDMDGNKGKGRSKIFDKAMSIEHE